MRAIKSPKERKSGDVSEVLSTAKLLFIVSPWIGRKLHMWGTCWCDVTCYANFPQHNTRPFPIKSLRSDFTPSLRFRPTQNRWTCMNPSRDNGKMQNTFRLNREHQQNQEETFSGSLCGVKQHDEVITNYPSTWKSLSTWSHRKCFSVISHWLIWSILPSASRTNLCLIMSIKSSFTSIPKKPSLIQQISCGGCKDEAPFRVPQIDNKIFV